MKKVSIIVPVYNMEDKIERCLNSLVNQTLEDIEIIIINDGSTDRSIEIIKKYQQTYKNKIKVIDQKNQGISVARNEGLALATAPFIGFVDSDDYVELDMYEKLYHKIKKSRADIVLCNYKTFTEKSEFTKIQIDFKEESSIQTNPKMINQIDFAPWNKLYKKSLFQTIKFPPNVKYEDLNTILKVFSKAKKIVSIDDYCYNYFINEKGETFTINEKIFDIFKILEDLTDYFKEDSIKVKKEIEILCCRKLFVYTELSLKKKDMKFTFQFLKDAYTFLERYYPNWKKHYVTSAHTKRAKILYQLQIHPYLYRLRLYLKKGKLDRK